MNYSHISMPTHNLCFSASKQKQVKRMTGKSSKTIFLYRQGKHINAKKAPTRITVSYKYIFLRCDRAIPARWSQKWFCLSSWKQKETQTELVKWERPERNQKPFWWRSPNHLCSTDWQFWLLINLLSGREVVCAQIIVSWSERHSRQTLTKQIAGVALLRDGTQFVEAPGVALVIVPRKLHHLRREWQMKWLPLCILVNFFTTKVKHHRNYRTKSECVNN